MTQLIFHITSRSSWISAQKKGIHSPKSLPTEGFIHCSKQDQVLRVANSIYTNQHDLVLLIIDQTRLTAEVRWEAGTDKPNESFPHIYGALNVDAVLRAYDFNPDPEGKFQLPSSLD